jgi:hypothetical protein
MGEEALIAPCGMNCALCRAYGRDRRACPGCRGADTNKSKSCVTCKIKNCETRISSGAEFCFQCKQFACHKIEQIDRRYRAKYGMSMIENLKNIQKLGLEHFVKSEKAKWACPECGEPLCVHKENCISCGYEWR